MKETGKRYILCNKQRCNLHTIRNKYTLLKS